jgi:signal transduction histidine kinase
VALGVLSYVRSTRALEDLLADRTAAIASRAAETLRQRYSSAMSDLLFLANNAETQRLLTEDLSTGGSGHDETISGRVGAMSGRGEAEGRPTREEALAFLDAAWRRVGASWAWAEIRDADGSVVHRVGEPPLEVEPLEPQTRSAGRTEYVLSRPIREVSSEAESTIGSIRGSLLLQEILPQGELEAGFGELGYSVVVDRDADRLLFHPRMAQRRPSLSTLLGPSGWDINPALLGAPSGTFRYSEDEIRRVASFVSLDGPPWTVISSESLEEFAAPFARTGSVNLIVVLLVTAVIFLVFIFVTHRATDSLRRLTTAAGEVAAGNLDPPLPPGGGDEVGKLSDAFSIMVERVRSMLRRVEESRHMSAIGEFAAQLSHEIRNPLTSIKLNLQRLDRGVKQSRIPQEYTKAVQLSLREAKRLDETVRGVLSISRTRAPKKKAESLHAIIQSSLEALSPQLEEGGIRVEAGLSAARDTVLGDRELLKSVFLNLFLNAVEVVDRGGVLRVSTENVPGEGAPGLSSIPGADPRLPGDSILVRIADTGPGVPEEIRGRIFDPFFTTKEGGSGFGLPLAARVAEEHSGALVLAEPGPGEKGATFLVVLPLNGGQEESR